MTGYTVSNNACVMWDVKSRLDDCEDHYHMTWDNKLCEIDKFEITWSYKDSAGNDTWDVTEVEYGQTPTHADVTKASTNEKVYIFIFDFNGHMLLWQSEWFSENRHPSKRSE